MIKKYPPKFVKSLLIDASVALIFILLYFSHHLGIHVLIIFLAVIILFKIFMIYNFFNGVTLNEKQLIIRNPFKSSSWNIIDISEISKIEFYITDNTSGYIPKASMNISAHKGKITISLFGFTEDEVFELSDDLQKMGIKTILS